MISITAAPEAPPPRIRILDARQREVETVRIGDRLTFRIEIPEDSEHFNFMDIFFYLCVKLQILTFAFYSSSSLWNLRPQLCRYGQGLKEHFPDYRWRRVGTVI